MKSIDMKRFTIFSLFNYNSFIGKNSISVEADQIRSFLTNIKAPKKSFRYFCGVLSISRNSPLIFIYYIDKNGLQQSLACLLNKEELGFI